MRTQKHKTIKATPPEIMARLPRSPETRKKVELKRGDWLRVRRGPLKGAEGSFETVTKVSRFVTVVEVRQLNGNLIRLPRAYWEFSALRPGDEIE